MESAKRGYVATGDESFLHPYIEGTKRFDPEFQALYLIVADNPQQQQRLMNIHAGYEDSEVNDSQTIALRRAGKADPTLLENQQRKHSLDTLREQMAEFQSVEEGLRIEPRSSRASALDPGSVELPCTGHRIRCCAGGVHSIPRWKPWHQVAAERRAMDCYSGKHWRSCYRN